MVVSEHEPGLCGCIGQVTWQSLTGFSSSWRFLFFVLFFWFWLVSLEVRGLLQHPPRGCVGAVCRVQGMSQHSYAALER